MTTVQFGAGRLGLVLSRSNRGSVVVTAFSSSSDGTMGQAQKSGRMAIGDEIVAVNGRLLDVIGIEGFKHIARGSARPLQVLRPRPRPFC